VDHVIKHTEGGHSQMLVPDDQVAGRWSEVFIESRPGDMLLFHPYLIHRSNINTSDKVRYSLVATYVNPMDERFKLSPLPQMVSYHSARCVNSGDESDNHLSGLKAGWGSGVTRFKD
jgi:ectoine hydroxylase-related dioxygenase (phytanoyl-CoA dioxygenase family)